MTMASVRVAVRVRPLNQRERELNSKLIINMKGHTTCIMDSKNSPSGHLGEGKSFTYDYSYDSTDSRSHNFVSQEKVFEDLGCDVLKDVFEGYNACVFAYGQTGSGKSYTMMGHKGDVGLIPRICEGLFGQISERRQSDVVSFHTEVSYLEIHNERVQDLLQKKSIENGGLRVREHPKNGPYVEDLSKHVVNNYSDVEELINMGNTNRTIASTGMNAVSSRSHAIFTINFTQARFDADMPCETLSKLNLVDLAGSERANSARSTGARLKEGANINRSLVTLGSVISALADLSESAQVANTTKRKKQVFVPYRDSVLTWLLKDSLGGNSKTIMIAAISPAHVNYGETLSTLRYACRAKNIVNTPTVNEDNSVKVIKELQEEIARLRGLVDQINQVYHGDLSTSQKVEAKLHESEAKVHALTQEWTKKWGETQIILKEETLALRKEGSGVVLDCQLPHLIGIDEDLLSTGIILYHLKEGSTSVGREEALSPQDIVLHGPGLQNEHCVLENQAGSVTLIPLNGALCSVNGAEVSQPWQLTQGALIRLGKGTMFRFNHPTEAAQLREKRKTGLLSLFNPSRPDPSACAEDLAKGMILNPGAIWLGVVASGFASPPETESSINACRQKERVELEKLQQEQLLKLENQRRHMQEAKEVQEKEEAELERRRREVEAQHKEWQEVQETLHRRNQEVERRLWKLLQHRKAFGGGEEQERGDPTNGPAYSPGDEGDGPALVDAPAEPVSTGADQHGPELLQTVQKMAVQLDANELESRLSSVAVLPAVLEPCMSCRNEAMPGSSLVSPCKPDADMAAPHPEACTREDRELESHASHKSGPGLTSTGLEGGAAGGASGADAGLRGGSGERPGDASLPQAVVPDAGDGCGAGPEGEANESHRAADGGGGGSPPGSGGSSLGGVSHLQGRGGAGSSTLTFPQAAARSPPSTPTRSDPPVLQRPEEASPEGRLGRGLMDGSGSPEEDRRESQVDSPPRAEQSSGVGSMVSKVSWMFQDAGRLLRSSPKVLQRVRKEGLQPVGACWSSQVVSLVSKSQVMAVVKDSQMFSLVMESQAISLVRDSQLLSMVKKLTQNFPPAETAGALPSVTTQDLALALFSDQTSTVKAIEMLQDQSLSTEVDLSAGQSTIGSLDSPRAQESTVKDVSTSKEQSAPEEHEAQEQPRLREQPCQSLFSEPAKSSVTTQDWEGVQVFCQNLLDFPEALLKLQALSPVSLVPSLLPAIPLAVLRSQRVLALYWLSAAKASQPLPRPALLVLLESALYTLTSDLEALELFHHLPLLQLTEIQVGFAGQSLDLTCTSKEGVLCLHTHSHALTQGLCRALLGALSPGQGGVSQHPLLQENLMALSLDWKACVPDLLLDPGPRLRCHFQKTLADLTYLLHGNMDQERASMGEVRLLLYTTVVVNVSPEPRASPRAQLLLTDTHLGLVQEDAVFHPALCAEAPEPRRSLFQDMALRRRSDIRCVLVRDGDADWSTKLDVIIARAGGRGHPERAAGGAVPSAQDSNSSPQPEVWKLTFGCSAEVACLINHLSNV